MIRLFRLDGLEIMLNIDMIKEIHSGRPTVLILANGERLEVKNTQTDVMTKFRACRRGKQEEDREERGDPPPAHKRKPAAAGPSRQGSTVPEP